VIQFEQLCERALAIGLAVRGAFHPEPGEFDDTFPGVRIGTIALLGFTGSAQWKFFQSSSEARDGAPHPLDRWSRRAAGALAREVDALDFYPDQMSGPALAFQRLALRAESVHRSPIGLLIDGNWGLWHAYRAGLVLPDRIELPRITPAAPPCAACATRPCLGSCPVQAFRPGLFDIAACVGHVLSEAGYDCRENGCLARRACPVGAQFTYVPDQMRFHMSAFLSSVRAPDAA
jgi:hypothetical protein